MTAGTIVFMVLAIVVGVALINLAVWIPIGRALRRLPDRVRGELEAAGHRLERGPERGVYRGASAGYGKVKGLGVIALTDRALVFRKLWGARIEIPRDAITGTRSDRWFLRSYAGGRTHVIVVLRDGAEVGFFVNDCEAWLKALAPAA